MSEKKFYRFANVLLMLALITLVGCYEKETPGPGDPAIADDDLSYRNEPLIADSGAPAVEFKGGEPGDNQLLARSFENAPPLIPHSLDDLLPITSDENQCLECHAPENAEDSEATPTPASHLYDIRRDVKLPAVNPANYNCDLCHVEQADTGELIDNLFEPHFRQGQLEKESNLLDILNEGVK